MNPTEAKQCILNANTALGIELGSTRIKAVLVAAADGSPLATGGHDWENRYADGVWTYRLSDIYEGLSASYASLLADVRKKYGMGLKNIGSIGVSAMMHGYMAFDKDGQLLTPFRTWRNTSTGEAALFLTELFNYNIPQRWSIAHLYQAILNQEAHVKDIDYITTLAAFVHWRLTGEKVIGVGDASGMFPIIAGTSAYAPQMVEKFDRLISDRAYPWKLRDIMPKTLLAGEAAGKLTAEGARLLDPSGVLVPGMALCAPEGDAGTGMVATNSVEKRTGNVSAGTSVFAMIVLEEELKKVYHEIDMVTTPDGSLVAMAHCNNCSSDLNAWVKLFAEFADMLDATLTPDALFELLYKKALEADTDTGGMLAYNYFSGEHITGFSEGRPLFVRKADGDFNLANFMRTHLFSSISALKIGLDILIKDEGVKVECIYGHGGLFKTAGVAQAFLAAALGVPVAVMESAGEGGAWGIALLAAYTRTKKADESLADFLTERIFVGEKGGQVLPDAEYAKSFEIFIERYKEGLAIERAAVENLKI